MSSCYYRYFGLICMVLTALFAFIFCHQLSIDWSSVLPATIAEPATDTGIGSSSYSSIQKLLRLSSEYLPQKSGSVPKALSKFAAVGSLAFNFLKSTISSLLSNDIVDLLSPRNLNLSQSVFCGLLLVSIAAYHMISSSSRSCSRVSRSLSLFASQKTRMTSLTNASWSLYRRLILSMLAIFLMVPMPTAASCSYSAVT